MTLARRFARSTVAALSLAATASCTTPGLGLDDPISASQAPEAATHVHIMPMVDPAAPVPYFSRTPHLANYGGPVLGTVNVIPVFWNSGVAYQSNLAAFYAAVTNSPWFSLLNQYSGIGHGTRGTPYVDTQATANTTDATVQAELTRLFNINALPAPNANNYYPVHFPAGMTITDSSGNKSCVTFCAYHGTYKWNGIDVNYGIVPDIVSGGCATGCGASPTKVNNLTSVSSHELAEATTDPGVGLATTYGPPLAWYDSRNGEIGDICNGQEATVVGGDGLTYTIQKLWSNARSACVAQ